jgi:hypothetical protein
MDVQTTVKLQLLRDRATMGGSRDRGEEGGGGTTSCNMLGAASRFKPESLVKDVRVA